MVLTTTLIGVFGVLTTACIAGFLVMSVEDDITKKPLYFFEGVSSGSLLLYYAIRFMGYIPAQDPLWTEVFRFVLYFWGGTVSAILFLIYSEKRRRVTADASLPHAKL